MKKIRSSILLVCLLAVVLALTSCVYSKNPLGDKEDSVIDPDLIGLWYAVDEEDPKRENYLAVSTDPDGYLKFITFDNAGSEPGEMRGYITEIQGDRYLNLQMIRIKDGSRQPEDEYMFAHYYIDENGQLVYAVLNAKFFEEAIKKQEIAGELPDKDKFFSSLKVTDSTDNLVRFLEKHGKKDYLDEEKHVLKNLRKSPNSDHDAGYKDGWEGAAKKGLTQDYLDGYENGHAAAYYNDLGYKDAQAGKKTKYPKDLDYMKGYEKGK